MTDNQTEDAGRAFARSLFSHPAQTDEAGTEDTTPGNHVPREGNHPGSPIAHDDPRETVRHLFSH